MLKRLHCQADVHFGITPVDPILIKSAYASISGAQMPFVTTVRNGVEEVYLPGSSLKGVIRSHAEKICRTLRNQSVCLPYQLEGNEESCGNRFKNLEKQSRRPRTVTSQAAYHYSCPACRLFGSSYFIGRFGIGDAYASPAPKTEMRDGVAINRHTGGAIGGAKFDYEVITHGDFQTVITIRNFEFWQLALLGFILQDFGDESIRIGSGKSRGLGKVRGVVEKFFLTYFDDTPNLRDLKDFCTPDEIDAYGLAAFQADTISLPQADVRGLRRLYDLTDNWQKAFEAVAPALSAYLDGHDWQKGINAYAENN